MTKKPGIVWNYYNKKIDGSQIVAFCKFCNQSYIQNATRMEKHLVRCEKCPESVKETFSKHRTAKSMGQGVKRESWAQPKTENAPDAEWDEAYEVETVECANGEDTMFEAEETARGSTGDVQSNNNDWEAVGAKVPSQSATQSSSAAASPQGRSSPQRKPALRRMSQWPLLPTRTMTSYSPLQSKILQEQLLERRIMRRVAELELRKKNLELERLQWEYERDKTHSEMKLAHEGRMMELREEREKQMLEQEMVDV